MKACVRAQSLQSCPTLCDPMDHDPPNFSVHGILQARILEWVAISFSSDKVWNEWSGWSEVAQSCPTLCGPMDYSPPGSSVHGILQARILEYVAISYSRASSRPRDWTWVSLPCRQTLNHLNHQGSPLGEATRDYKTWLSHNSRKFKRPPAIREMLRVLIFCAIYCDGTIKLSFS